jgi:hypothetical protein
MARWTKCGEPYFYHPLRVGLSLLPDLEAAIGEDTSLRFPQIEALFVSASPKRSTC